MTVQQAMPRAAAGDRIQIESERVGQPNREGVIVAVHETPTGVDYEVRWDDGHLTSFRPAAGSVRIFPAEPAPEPARI